MNDWPFIGLHEKLFPSTFTHVSLYVRSRIYKERIDGDSYHTFKIVYIGKKFVFLKEPLYLINQ